MRLALCGCGLLLAAATAASTADPAVDELFKQAREKVLDNARRMPHYTCVETVSRAEYQPSRNAGTCQSLIALRKLAPSRGVPSFRDRLRLDVAVIDNNEIFSWAGAGKFETHDVGELVGGGAAGSGEFGGFAASVFGSAPDSIRFIGRRDSLALFEYNVPVSRSNYRLHVGPQRTEKLLAYHGTFSIDPDDADLEQLLVESDQFGRDDEVCQVRHTMNYSRVKIGKSDFMLPDVSTMEALYRNGAESVNETHYSECREYVGESTIRFDDDETTAVATAAKAAALVPLAPKIRLEVGLTKSIDTGAAAAGDAVEGVILRDAGDRKKPAARAGDKVHGRILRLQQYSEPLPLWLIAIRFDTIERAGAQQPIALRPLDDGNRSGQTSRAANQRMANLPDLKGKPEGVGLFVFQQSGNFALGKDFHSAWETR
ncbi:MAG TPA: hypothetical protein VG297_20910 [Bryobacteraceae bacterium]|nr:hypothetical protein [Bryobacteraceae bacterium]